MGKRYLRSGFKSISEVIESEKDFLSLRESMKNFDVTSEFEKIFPELKIIAQAVKVDKKVLFLKVENSVWKSELNFQKKLIVEKINKHFKIEVIKSIKFL